MKNIKNKMALFIQGNYFSQKNYIISQKKSYTPLVIGKTYDDKIIYSKGRQSVTMIDLHNCYHLYILYVYFSSI